MNPQMLNNNMNNQNMNMNYAQKINNLTNIFNGMNVLLNTISKIIQILY